MWIEVMNKNGETTVWHLNMPKMLIGSSESNDIVIKAPGVSRKHLLVITKECRAYLYKSLKTRAKYSPLVVVRC